MRHGFRGMDAAVRRILFKILLTMYRDARTDGHYDNIMPPATIHWTEALNITDVDKLEDKDVVVIPGLSAQVYYKERQQ